MSTSTATLLVQTLVRAGVKRIYGVVGDSLNGITDALRSGGEIDWIHMRHEEGAAFAAGAEAHLTGELAVCAGSCGPGNLHLINGLFDCHRSGVPVLAIAAHIPSTEIGIDYFQATHPEKLFEECSHYVELVSTPDQLLQVLTRAIRVAVARRGVAVIVIPGDVALKPAVGKPPQWLLPAALGNRCSLNLGVLGDVKETLVQLLPALQDKTDTGHLDAALRHYRKSREDLDALSESGPDSGIIHPQYLTRLVSELAADDAIFTCDVGTPVVWAARYLKLNGRRRLIGSFNHGSMANAMLQAIGAQSSAPQRQVISLSGDGGFTMMMGDFNTLVQQRLPIKIVVLNNGTLGFVELEMKANGFLPTGVDLKNPNFASMAESMGIKGIRVEKPQDLRAALSAAFRHPGPALVDVVSARQELALPPKTTLGEAYHFGMFTLKAILDGRGRELIDLARTNLLR